MTSTHTLGSLYREALKKLKLDPGQCTFEGPLLRQHGVNRVIWYPGCFNPPHIGHKQLLMHALENAGEDLHIAGAIVCPTDDENLRIKLCHKRYCHAIAKTQRVQLLEESGMPRNIVWVCPLSNNTEFGHAKDPTDRFKEAVVEVAARARLDVKFVLLSGPDYVRIDCAPIDRNNPKPVITDVITTDVSRPVDFRTANGLVQISDYQGWGKVSFHINKLRPQMRGKLRGQPSESKTFSSDHVAGSAANRGGEADFEAEVQAAAAKIRAVWVCYRQRKPRGWIRFIPADLSEQPQESPSSTEIRKIMATAPNDRPEAELGQWALSAGLLATFVQEAKRRGEKFEQVPQPEPKKHEYDPAKVKW
jgi:hypothetical protein